jgi:two-component system nitrogen regulation response regulator GlnG
MLAGSGHLLLPEFLPEHLLTEPAPAPQAANDAGGNLEELIESRMRESNGRVHEDVVAAVERKLFRSALLHTHGNITQAAELLGLSRATLRLKMRALGLSLDKIPTEGTPPGAD